MTPYLGVVFEASVERAGKTGFDCACHAGLGRDTYLHAVGDGAVWLREPVEPQLGTQGHYWVDCYHAGESLSAAVAPCQAVDRKLGFNTPKHALKNRQTPSVIKALESELEPEEVDDQPAPLRAGYRYLNHRREQLDYLGARSRGLPIGSGEIDSAHRYIIPERIKKPGAWWTAHHASNMLTLRVARANGHWESYWQSAYQEMPHF